MNDAPNSVASGKNSLIPSLNFDSDDFDPDDRLDAMNEFSRGLYHYRIADEAGVPMLSLRAWQVGELSAAKFGNSPIYAASAQGSGSDLGDTLFIRLIRTGSVWAKCDDDEALQAAGDVHLMPAENSLWPTEHGSVVSIRIPYESVGYEPTLHPKLLTISSKNAVGRLLQMTLTSFFDALPTMTVEDAAQIEPTLTGLIRGFLSSERPDDQAYEALQDARAAAMKRYVIDHITADKICVGCIQQQFNVSRATVYRAFDNVGGVARFIRDQRLNAIHNALKTTPAKPGVIRRIAEKHGFWDQSSFYRAFRSVYGVRPSDVVGAGTIDRYESTSPVPIGIPTLASFWAGSPMSA